MRKVGRSTKLLEQRAVRNAPRIAGLVDGVPVITSWWIDRQRRDEYRTEDTIQALDDLHKRFEAGSISYERFEETKLELFSRLSID